MIDIIFAHNGHEQKTRKRVYIHSKWVNRGSTDLILRRVMKVTHQGATPDYGGVWYVWLPRWIYCRWLAYTTLIFISVVLAVTRCLSATSRCFIETAGHVEHWGKARQLIYEYLFTEKRYSDTKTRGGGMAESWARPEYLKLFTLNINAGKNH